MKQRKPNIKAWYSLALVMLLCIGLLAVATGTTLARYRAEQKKDLSFRVRPPEQIHLGIVELEEVEGDPPTTKEVFVPTAKLAWVTEKDVTRLKFAVANGVSNADHSARDQKIHLRLIASVGVWNGTQTPVLTLTLPPEEGETEPKTVTATVEPLAEGTALYHTHGQGWLYTFLDKNQEELFWELDGGELSFLTFIVTIDEAVPDDPSLLQPYVVAEVIPD